MCANETTLGQACENNQDIGLILCVGLYMKSAKQFILLSNTHQFRKEEVRNNTTPLGDRGSIYTTKIDGVVCPPNISETVAVRTVKLAHRPRIASTTIKLISKPILLSIL